MALLNDIAGIITAPEAAGAVADSNIAAEHGVLNAASNGQGVIQDAINNTYTGVNSQLQNGQTAVNGQLQASSNAVNQAGQGVTDAANAGNQTLSGALNTINGNLAPGLASGAQGNTSLQQYAASNPQFNFDPSKYINSAGYNFQLQQGQNAITNQASAQGLSNSGATLAALTQYGQGLASTYYNNAFNQAQSQFQTNQNTTLSNLQALINSGNTANALSSNATQNIAGQQSANTIGAANTNAGLQQYLAGLNTQGQEDLLQNGTATELGLGSQALGGAEAYANLGLSGATTAGNFATNAGLANAAGITGTGAAYAGLGTDLATAIAGLQH